MSLPSSSNTEMMPVSTKSVQGVKSVINLGLVWTYSLKNTAFINSLFYRTGRNGNLSHRQKQCTGIICTKFPLNGLQLIILDVQFIIATARVCKQCT